MTTRMNVISSEFGLRPVQKRRNLLGRIAKELLFFMASLEKARQTQILVKAGVPSERAYDAVYSRQSIID